MGNRCLGLSGALAVIAAVFALTPASLASQNQRVAANAAPPPAAKPWTPSRTADGQPDFQGVWRNNSATPLERPKALEGRESLTDAEVAAMSKRAAQFRQNGSDFAPGDGLFLAALAGQEQYKNAQATCRLDISDEKIFDNRTSLIIDPPDGKIPPLTPAAQQRQRRAVGGGPAGPEDLANNMRCITNGVPRLGGNSADYGGYLEIIQSSGYLVLLDESIHEARVIPLDGRPHVADSVRLWNGDSRGRWEGSTLVVDTTNFSPKSNFRGSAENLHLVERFTRVSPELIHYELTLDDPTTWTRPWTAVIHLNLSHDKLYESACHEGNFDIIRDVLNGARADEKAAAERAGATSTSPGIPNR